MQDYCFDLCSAPPCGQIHRNLPVVVEINLTFDILSLACKHRRESKSQQEDLALHVSPVSINRRSYCNNIHYRTTSSQTVHTFFCNRVMTNKMLLAVIIIMEMAILGAVVYLKFFRH